MIYIEGKCTYGLGTAGQVGTTTDSRALKGERALNGGRGGSGSFARRGGGTKIVVRFGLLVVWNGERISRPGSSGGGVRLGGPTLLGGGPGRRGVYRLKWREYVNYREIERGCDL